MRKELTQYFESNTTKEDIVTTSNTGSKKLNYLCMAAHICSDVNQGALAAILPFLVVYQGYSYTAVAMLIFAANIASAVIQPLFGVLGDKLSCPWFMALGVFLAGCGMCGVGLLPSFELVVVSAMVSGIGIAMFHPEGGRLANLAAGERKSNGMSIFAVGGNIGFFLGPLLIAAFIPTFGLQGSLVFLVPAFVCPAILLYFNGQFKALGTAASAAQKGEEVREHWGKFSLVLGILSLRSIVFFGLMVFIPIFMMDVLGQPEATSSAVLSVFSICGAVATALSGKTTERFGTHRVLVLGFIALAGCIICFMFSRSIVLSVLLVGLMAAVNNISHPSVIALGMSYIPKHLGTASGLTYGVSIAIGGVAEPFLGIAGDTIGLEPVMWALAGVALIVAAMGILSCRLHSRK